MRRGTQPALEGEKHIVGEHSVLPKTQMNKFKENKCVGAHSVHPKTETQKIKRENMIKEKEIERLTKLKEIENKLHSEGIHYIAGIDEAGRGPLAGPVVVRMRNYETRFFY